MSKFADMGTFATPRRTALTPDSLAKPFFNVFLVFCFNRHCATAIGETKQILPCQLSDRFANRKPGEKNEANQFEKKNEQS
jgi:hypothetical protein